MLKAAYYARTSTANQEKEETIESQVDEIEKKIKEDGNVLLPHLGFKDEGWPGDLLARPGLDRMRDAAKNKEFEILYMYDRGRVARKYHIQELVIEELEELGIQVITLHDVNAQTPEEKVLQSMQGVFHEYERVKIAERMRRGKLYKTRSGKLLGYQAPYGYDYILKTKDKDGHFKINKEEAKVVKMIFDWVGNQGHTIMQVIKKLYELKIYPRKRKRDFWTNSPIYRMLKNETYIGTHYYNRRKAAVPKNPKNNIGRYKKIKKSSRIIRPKEEWIPIKVPAIIDKELFYKVQNQLKINSERCNRNKKRNYLLSGKIYCTCGNKRTGEPSTKHKYYRCAERIYNFPLPRTCFEKGINADVLDKLVYDNIVKLLTDERMIRKQAIRWFDSRKDVMDIKQEEIDNLRSELGKIKEQEERYLKAFGLGVTSLDIYQKQMSELKEKRDILINRIQEAEKKVSLNNNIPKLDINNIVNKAKESLKAIDFKDKCFVVRKLIDKVVANQKIAIIYGFIPIGVASKNVQFNSIHWNNRSS